jgi:sugar phosphate isomerase/epimerase
VPSLAAFPKGFFDALVGRRMTLLRWIELAGELDLDGVELYPRFFESFDRFDAAEVARVRREAEARGLALPMMCHSPDFTQPDAGARDAEVELTRRLFHVTANLGGRFCRVLSGQNRPGLDEREAMKWVADCLWRLTPLAESAGVVMVIENHYKDGLWKWPEFAQSRERFLALLDAVDTPLLRVQYDPSNAVVAGDDPYELLERVLPRVATMQASDRYLEGGTVEDLRRRARDPEHGYAPFLKHGVIGRGLNDYDRIFSTLARAGWDGWVSIEDGDGPTVEIGMQNLRDSATFLRAKLAQHFGG